MPVGKSKNGPRKGGSKSSGSRASNTVVIAVGNQKGGVGKTATSVNIAAAMASTGRTTLLVDTDPQGGASDSLGYMPHKDLTLTVGAWYRNPEPLQATRHILETSVPNLSLMPNSLDAMDAANSIANDPLPSLYLQRFLRSPAIKDKYDYVIIDTPPNLDIHFNNAIMAADYVIIPVTPELKTVRGLVNLQQALAKLSDASSMRVLGLLLTKVQAQLNTHKRVIDFFRSTYGNEVFNTMIALSKDFPEADEHSEPSVLRHAPDGKSAESIVSVIEEMLERISAVGTGRRTKPKLWDGKVAKAYDALAESL